jgi:hypothetical protein
MERFFVFTVELRRFRPGRGTQEQFMEKLNQIVHDERGRIERKEDDVAINSDESFPASDAPSWTPVHGVGGHETRKRKQRERQDI